MLPACLSFMVPNREHERRAGKLVGCKKARSDFTAFKSNHETLSLHELGYINNKAGVYQIKEGRRWRCDSQLVNERSCSHDSDSQARTWKEGLDYPRVGLDSRVGEEHNSAGRADLLN